MPAQARVEKPTKAEKCAYAVRHAAVYLALHTMAGFVCKALLCAYNAWMARNHIVRKPDAMEPSMFTLIAICVIVQGCGDTAVQGREGEP